MSKSSNKPTNALIVLSSTELVAKDEQLEKLKDDCINQVAIIARMDRNVARGGIICGLTLHRVKASLPFGQFRPFIEQMLPKVTSWTAKSAVKNASFLMRLSEVFVTKAHISKPDILALPGDPLALSIEENQIAEKIATKLNAFVGECSLNELLIKHGIKGVGLKKALEAEEKKESGAPTAPDAEQLYLQYRDEAGGLILRAESLFLQEGCLSHLIGHPEELKGIANGLRSLADKVEREVKDLLAIPAVTEADVESAAIPAAEDMA